MSDEPFPGAEMEGELYSAGDIIISLDTVRENSEYFKVDEEEELKRVIIHGILHLLDINDKTEEEKKLMTMKEDWALEELKRFM